VCRACPILPWVALAAARIASVLVNYEKMRGTVGGGAAADQLDEMIEDQEAHSHAPDGQSGPSQSAYARMGRTFNGSGLRSASLAKVQLHRYRHHLIRSSL
jgi:hypothetical protein